MILDNSQSINNTNRSYVKDRKSKRKKQVVNMLFREFIQKNLSDLSIPYGDTDKKYPDEVWKVLHKSFLTTQLQHFVRADTVKSFIESVYEGNDLGGLTMDNIIDMWVHSMIQSTYEVVGLALTNPKIRELYENMITEHDVECTQPHNATEDRLVSEGVELPTHTHVVQYVVVTDENKEEYEKLIDLILRNFDSDVYGELPEEYRNDNPDFDTMFSKMKGMFDETNIDKLLKDDHGTSDFI